jgi:hypothetical protein
MKQHFLLISLMIFITFTSSGCVNRTKSNPAPPVEVSAPTQEEIELIVVAVLEKLKDPDSAKFGKVILVDHGKGACIEVNAKNTYGGYTGYQQAMVMNVVDGWYTAGIKDITLDHCIRAVHSVLNDQGYL